ncbi:MAG: winged helix DNA-binding protein [Deltaproteobacteria bacterium]|nr:winged helix DNA-binding protein [Deltaproteobacteria bacterium]MCB9786641.1 winged helix DNA-binding protein [Deltaproteobacteria bacterium]
MEVAHEVLRAIRRIVRRISAHSKHLSREMGLTVPQILCLKAIGELGTHEPEVTVAMVAARVQLSAATVSRILDRLVRAGLVAAERRSRDRRRVCLSLTAEGRQGFEALPTPLQDSFVERFTALSDAERDQILGALERITELMGAADLDAAPILTPEGDVKGDWEPE